MARTAAPPPRRSGLASSAAAVAIALAALPLQALQAATAEPTAGIDAGSAVRIRTVDRGSYEGRLRSGDLESVTLLIEGRTETFEVTDIDALWKGGRAVGTGAAIGAVSLGVATAAFGAYACEALSENTGCDEWGAVTVFGLLGGAAGAGIGALIGAFVRTWDLRWPVPPDGPDIGFSADRRWVVGLAIGV